MGEREKSFDDVCMYTDTCALAGASAFFAGMRDAVIVVNGPLWCYYFAMRHIEHSQSTISHRMACTQLDNDAIVFGAEEYLQEALAPYVEQPPALLAIVSSCAAGLIGDDIAAIARGAGLACPVVALDSSGLAGSFADGWDKAARAALQTVPLERTAAQSHAVNLIGMTDAYYNGANDARELVRLLQIAGYTVNAVLGNDMSAEDFPHLTQAALNIVVHGELGRGSAQLLEEMYGMPWIAPFPPYGRAGTRHWMQEIADVLPSPHAEAAETEIDRVTREDFLRINECKMLWGELRYDTAVVRAPDSMAWGLWRRHCVRSGQTSAILPLRQKRSAQRMSPVSRMKFWARRMPCAYSSCSARWRTGSYSAAATSPRTSIRSTLSICPLPIPRRTSCV